MVFICLYLIDVKKKEVVGVISYKEQMKCKKLNAFFQNEEEE